MWNSLFKQIAKFLLIGALLTPMMLPLEANAQIYEGVRQMDWNSGDGRCNGGGYNEKTKKHTANTLDFNPLGPNPDYNFEMTNGVCLAFVSAVGAALLASKTSSYLLCTAKNPIGAGLMSAEFAQERATASDFPYVSPGLFVSLGLRGKQCTSRSSEYALLASAGGPQSPGALLASADVAACCPSAAFYAVTFGSAMAALAVTYGVASGVYQKAKICGSNWRSWSKDDGSWKAGAYEGSYKKSIQDDYISGKTPPDMSNSRYREYIFGGIEYEDSGDGACKSPNWSAQTRKNILGYTDDPKYLKYYMVGSAAGSNSSPAFACYRYLASAAQGASADEIKEGQAAYDCCTRRSQTTICIENAPMSAKGAPDPAGVSKYKHAFCEVGSRCNVNGIWFDAYISHSKANYACAKTYSVCPYNHPLGGGTEVADYSDPNDLSTIQNYCQYGNHCSILPIAPYVIKSSLTGAFFDSSCRDMKGDSQNVYGYTMLDIRGFSSPMAQCFKETMQNIFFNKAGNTVCLDPSELPDKNGQCKTSGYKYKKGDDLSSYQKSIGQSGDSFFVRVQRALQDTVKMALSLAIMFFGVSVLIGGSAITKKQLMPLVVKIAFVMFFAVDNWWQAPLLNGIIGSASELSDIMFRTDSLTGTTSTPDPNNPNVVVVNYSASVDANKLDGCQFPRYNYAADVNDPARYDIQMYPPGKEYLRIWDTLDCKIARAFGYGIEVSVPNIAMMIFAGLFTGGAGVVFIVATFAFAFFLIAMTIRALHIFILSTMSIIILFYIAPIAVTMIMFSRTKGIFDKWWKNILGFALQPMILFAYMGILLTFFDTIIMGDVTFKGDGKSAPKQIVCTGAAVNTSIYCIFNPPVSGPNAGVKGSDALKILGIGIPVLTSMNSAKISALIKAAVLFFIFMNFLDKISDFAKTLVGGEALNSKTMGAIDMLSKAHGMAGDIQKRGVGGLKQGLKVARSGAGMAKRGIAALGGGERRAKGAGSGGDTAVRNDSGGGVDVASPLHSRGGDQGSTPPDQGGSSA